ncbi:MAG TPA: CAP domain-containing protein, partial [bacterium]
NRTATDHALYLQRNRVQSHDQVSGRPGFTGRHPTDRARHVGYVAAGVSENLAQGMDTVTGAVEDLMTAIYHRFGFLAVGIDELGVGWAPGKASETPWVFNMSDAGLNAWCAKPPAEAVFTPPGTYTQLCGEGSARLKLAAVEAQQRRLPMANPPWVLWPPPDYTSVPPAFFEETPDPLPDRSVSGYPVSIQFNRYKVRAVALREFRMVAVGANGAAQDVGPVRRLDQRTDPNHEFSTLDFAWFPLDRLAWNARYRVAADFDVDGKPQHFEWEFRTKDLGMPVIPVAGADPVIALRPNLDYALYLAPTDQVPSLSGFRWEGPGNMKTQADGIDPNTLKVRVSGPACSLGLLTFSGGRRVRLQVAEADGAGCEVTRPDFSITANSERLSLQPGKAYRVQVKASSRGKGVEKLGWQFPSTMKVAVELEPPDVARITVTGRPCDAATFELSGGRKFTALVAGPGCPATTTGKER